MYDVIIVGAGAAGVAAALELARRGVRPLILDVGHGKPPAHRPLTENFYTYRESHDTFDLMIGDRSQGLANLVGDDQVPVKLTSPVAEYITRDADRLSPYASDEFHLVQSFATGGLANAWGAGLYRFSARELADFPLDETDLDPYFDVLTGEIGISGCSDDLDPYFGTAEGLLPPLRLSRNIGRLHDRYLRRKDCRDGDILLGHGRVGVLTEPRDGRPATAYDNLEFWQESSSLYKPRLTLERLIAAGQVDYRRGFQVRSCRDASPGAVVAAVDTETGAAAEFEARKVLLAAGAVNTTRIVLASAGDHDAELPLLENPALQFPLILPGAVGEALDRNAFGLVQLNLVWESREFGELLQGSIMDVTSPSRGEFFASLPLAARANLSLIKYLLPGMIVMQLFFPSASQEPSWLSLDPEGVLRIRAGKNTLDTGRTGQVLAFLRRLGAWSHPALSVRVPTGHAIHYAGTLPMRKDPGRYECDPHGLLGGAGNVFVADSAAFPSLPAKNMSFTMMANAMRVAAGAIA